MNDTPSPGHPDPHRPHPHDIAEPGPIDPSTGQPDHHAEVSALKTWLRQNVVSLVITAAIVALVCVYLDPLDTLKVVIGLGLVIFIHELGHFLAAKWCDVHVKTFSIGFGPAVPFCSYKWGETTYMLGIIPLGGYVSMVGENTGEGTGADEPEEEENDPRSFKAKSVGSRMLIISAGVIMNVILGLGCFAAAYLHGVKEKPATVGYVETGSAAWRAGIRTDDEIRQIGSREKPFFNDIRSVVMSSRKGQQIPVVIERPGGGTVSLSVEPLRDEGVPFPQLGVGWPLQLTLVEFKKKTNRPVTPGSPAAEAEPNKFEGGDRIVAMSDPDKGGAVTPLAKDRAGRPDFDDYYRRMVKFAAEPGGKDVTFHVLRKDQPDGAEPTAIPVKPAFRADLGVRMQMGKVAAVRAGGPADGKVQAVPIDGPPNGPGDQIVAVGVTDPDGKRVWYANGTRPAEAKPEDAVRPLDPVLLPLELKRWAGGFPAEKRAELSVDLVVLREVEHTEKRVPLTLKYDDSFRYDREVVNLPNSPLPVSGLGLAYFVATVVEDVAADGPAHDRLKPNDKVIEVRFKAKDADGNVKPGDWEKVKDHQWAFVDAALQRTPPYELDLKVERGGPGQVVEVTVTGKPDTRWPVEERGLVFQPDYRIQKAEDLGEALSLGGRRTVRFIQDVYMNLYGMIRGRISARTMSGPLTIATVSYKIAGEDFWQFLLFLGMISVNLAVVNFLPIPVLDGGHMVFLLYERITGRPLPERVFAIAMYTGLAMILALFIFVITLDVRRLFFGLF